MKVEVDQLCPTFCNPIDYTVNGVLQNVIALYNNSVVNPTWSITSGNQYATINQSGEITIIDSGEITVSAT